MWTEELLNGLNRRKARVTFDPHALDRAEYWNLDLEKVDDTVRTGSVVRGKSEKPNKLCFKKYYGKENITYIVMVRYYIYLIEVKTVWPKQGR